MTQEIYDNLNNDKDWRVNIFYLKIKFVVKFKFYVNLIHKSLELLQ